VSIGSKRVPVISYCGEVSDSCHDASQYA
jgi:hypothetical protein